MMWMYIELYYPYYMQASSCWRPGPRAVKRVVPILKNVDDVSCIRLLPRVPTGTVLVIGRSSIKRDMVLLRAVLRSSIWMYVYTAVYILQYMYGRFLQ